MAIMSQFRSLITISPLGLMYASAGGFLSPENLVGRANSKFPPDAATIAGLLLNANREQHFADPESLKNKLVITGPFWANRDNPKAFYVPIPWHRVIDEKENDEWQLIKKSKSTQNHEVSEQSEDTTTKYLNQYQWHRLNKEIKPAYSWQLIDTWDVPTDEWREMYDPPMAKIPWKYTPFLHPKIKPDERHVVEQDGLFLENAVQLPEDICLVYLSNIDSHDLELFNGWYRLGGEGHLVEIESHALSNQHKINRLLRQKIQHAFALITPGVWGSNKLSHRYPQQANFPDRDIKLLTDKAVPYRYRIGQFNQKNAENSDRYNPQNTGRLSRGRYAVPAGSVYVLRDPLDMTWWDFPDEWFPKEGFPLKHLGCGLCLPIEIQGVPKCTEKLTA
jgi:CRISPR-associated protein Cmr3